MPAFGIWVTTLVSTGQVFIRRPPLQNIARRLCICDRGGENYGRLFIRRLDSVVYSILVPGFLGSKPVCSASQPFIMGRSGLLLRTIEKGASEHPGRIAKIILTPTLLVSGLVGMWIVANDGWLRAVAPTHAYGLLAFAVLDLVLALVVMAVPRIAYAGALLVSITQVAAMAGDALSFTPTGTLQAAFRAYLLGDMAFLALLGIQFAVAGITATAIAMPHAARHGVHFHQAKALKSLR